MILAFWLYIFAISVLWLGWVPCEWLITLWFSCLTVQIEGVDRQLFWLSWERCLDYLFEERRWPVVYLFWFASFSNQLSFSILFVGLALAVSDWRRCFCRLDYYWVCLQHSQLLAFGEQLRWARHRCRHWRCFVELQDAFFNMSFDFYMHSSILFLSSSWSSPPIYTMDPFSRMRY